MKKVLGILVAGLLGLLLISAAGTLGRYFGGPVGYESLVMLSLTFCQWALALLLVIGYTLLPK